jgi:hypothetical protein
LSRSPEGHPHPAAGRRPARELPESRCPAHLVLGQQLLGQATARAPHGRGARTAPPTLLRTPATFSLPPSGRLTATAPGPAPPCAAQTLPALLSHGAPGSPAVPGELGAGRGGAGRGPDSPGRGQASRPRLPVGGADHAARGCGASCACVKGAAPLLGLELRLPGTSSGASASPAASVGGVP